MPRKNEENDPLVFCITVQQLKSLKRILDLFLNLIVFFLNSPSMETEKYFYRKVSQNSPRILLSKIKRWYVLINSRGSLSGVITKNGNLLLWYNHLGSRGSLLENPLIFRWRSIKYTIRNPLSLLVISTQHFFFCYYKSVKRRPKSKTSA